MGIEFPVEDLDAWNDGNKIVEEIMGQDADSAGTGFGLRDMQYYTGDQAVAESWKQKADQIRRALKIRFKGSEEVHTSVSEYEEEE